MGVGICYDIYILLDKNGCMYVIFGFLSFVIVFYNFIESIGLKVSYVYVIKGVLFGDGVLMRDFMVIY